MLDVVAYLLHAEIEDDANIEKLGFEEKIFIEVEVRVSGSGGLIVGLIEIQCFGGLAMLLLVFGVGFLCEFIASGGFVTEISFMIVIWSSCFIMAYTLFK